jgi:hypothetical protein
MRSRHLSMLTLIFVLASALASAAFAQGTATGTAVPQLTPGPSCENPGNPPTANSSELGRAAVEMKKANWNKSIKAYMECLKAFITEQQALAAPHVRAANTTIEEYNKAIKVFNDSVDAAKQ